MSDYDVLPEIDSHEERQTLADMARIYSMVQKGAIPGTKTTAAVLGAAGLSQTAGAQPDRDDTYPEVGLNNDRVDGWADGVDAIYTYNRQLGEGVSNITTSGTYTIQPVNGNSQHITVDGDSTFDIGSASGRDGYSISVLLTSDNQRSLSWDSSISFDGGNPPTTIERDYGFLVGFRTYDGGSTWNANYNDFLKSAYALYDEGQYENEWSKFEPSESSGTHSRNSDHLYAERSGGVGLVGWRTDFSVDWSLYDTIEVDWESSGSGDISINPTNETNVVYTRTTPFDRTVQTIDISSVSNSDSVDVDLWDGTPSYRMYNIEFHR